MNEVPLTKLQREIMSEFYSIKPTRVIFNKTERDDLWEKAISRESNIDFALLDSKCPALSHQIRKSYESGKNIQSATFSECVYAQTFANMLSLEKFVNCLEDSDFIPDSIKQLLKSYHLFPRYSYSNANKSRMLIQAGGCNGIDSALITVINLNIYTIEFKEPSAKTSEPDLPKYKEDGILRVTDKFLLRYPQFNEMLKEQTGLNFFEVMGSNINKFSKESIDIAISNNYTKKYADVICTEDINGYLVMIPANQVSNWANIVGEIRPAGRNHYDVWTPNALKRFLMNKKAKFNGNKVTINKEQLGIRTERGGNKRVSGYKINPLFFIYTKHCEVKGSLVSFDIGKVQQLNPTITGKMFFRELKYDEVKEYYKM